MLTLVHAPKSGCGSSVWLLAFRRMMERDGA